MRWGRHEPDAPQQRAARLAARSSASCAVSPHDQGRGVVEAPSCFMSIQEAPIVCARRQSSAPELGAPLCSAGQGGTRGGGAAYLPRSRSSPFPISAGGAQKLAHRRTHAQTHRRSGCPISGLLALLTKVVESTTKSSTLSSLRPCASHSVLQ